MRTVYGPTTETRLVRTTDRVERLERRPLVYDLYEEMKVFSDLKNVKVMDWKWEVSNDLVGKDILGFKIYVTTPGASCTCRLWNETQGWDILKAPLTIPAGDYSACTILDDIDETKNHVRAQNASGDWVLIPQWPPLHNDRLWMRITAAGGKGLGFIVWYGRDRRP